MIVEIQKKIERYLPLIVEKASWEDPTLSFYGNEWSFSAITAWRMILNNKLIFGSDDGDNPEVVKLIKNSRIMYIEPQTGDFPVDPVFCFENGYRLEIFSDASFDTWTFRVPNEPLYDFTISGVERIKISESGVFKGIERALPLFLQSASYDRGILILEGIDWRLSVSSSWRFVSMESELFGASEQRGRDVLRKIKNIHLESIQMQSNQFPVDPVLFFSNGYRLEVFSSRSQQPWIFQLPMGKVFVGSPATES